MKLEIDEYQIDASQVQALEEAQENQRDWHQLKTNRCVGGACSFMYCNSV